MSTASASRQRPGSTPRRAWSTRVSATISVQWGDVSDFEEMAQAASEPRPRRTRSAWAPASRCQRPSRTDAAATGQRLSGQSWGCEPAGSSPSQVWGRPSSSRATTRSWAVRRTAGWSVQPAARATWRASPPSSASRRILRWPGKARQPSSSAWSRAWARAGARETRVVCSRSMAASSANAPPRTWGLPNRPHRWTVPVSDSAGSSARKRRAMSSARLRSSARDVSRGAGSLRARARRDSRSETRSWSRGPSPGSSLGQVSWASSRSASARSVRSTRQRAASRRAGRSASPARKRRTQGPCSGCASATWRGKLLWAVSVGPRSPSSRRSHASSAASMVARASAPRAR